MKAFLGTVLPIVLLAALIAGAVLLYQKSYQESTKEDEERVRQVDELLKTESYKGTYGKYPEGYDAGTLTTPPGEP